MTHTHVLKIFSLSTFSLFVALSGCKKNENATTGTDISETSQQIGDAMASVDESGGSGGSLTSLETKSAERAFARLMPSSAPAHTKLRSFTSALVPEAQATTCFAASTFSSCSSNVITRTFNSCTIGSTTLDGTVTLTWNDTAINSVCAIAADGHSITRSPNFTITGRRGGTLTATKTGTNGQVVTRTASGVFSFTNDGIRRSLAYSGSTLFDFTTETTAALTITGALRSGRTLTSTGGAALKVTNNITGVVCSYVPTDVTWGSTCNCATSGSWSSTCSDGKSSTLILSGCGTGVFTMGPESETVSFDRCYGS